MKYYEIKLHPTQRTLHLFVGAYDPEQVEKICGKGVNIDPNCYGAYVTSEVNNEIEPIMWIKYPKRNATYIHETVHCVTDLMKCTGIEDDEFRAWYTEWLFNTLQDARR